MVGASLLIPQALATAHDSPHGHPESLPGRNAYIPPHSRIGNHPEKADLGEIPCNGSAFGQGKESIPPTPAHVDSPNKSP